METELLTETQTRVFQVAGSKTADQTRVWVTACDPGGADAWVPVLHVLRRNPQLSIELFTRGKAAQIFSAEFPLVDITPPGGASQFVSDQPAPHISLVSVSSVMDVEIPIAKVHPDIPVVVIDDYYKSCFGYLSAVQDGTIKPPVAICVMDQRAHDIVVERFPELGTLVQITGQPAFARFYEEDTAHIATRVKQKLNIDERQLVSFMSSHEGLPFCETFAQAAAPALSGVDFVFRKHPRDATSYEIYEEIFLRHGVSLTAVPADVTNDNIIAASDLVIGRRTTALLHAIHRRKLTIHIDDGTHTGPLPPVESGASILAPIADIAETITTLLAAENQMHSDLITAMENSYLTDSGSTERIATIVHQILADSSKVEPPVRPAPQLSKVNDRSGLRSVKAG